MNDDRKQGVCNMLQQFGFTQYESQVYRALITIDQAMDATSIVKRSEVPRSKVYDVLQKLVGKGIVLESTTEKKRLYTALPLHLTIEKLKADFEWNVQALKETKMKETPMDDRVWTLKDNQSIQVSLKHLVQKAVSSIFISAWADDVNAILPFLEEKYHAGLHVTVHVIGEIETIIPNTSTLIPDTEHSKLERSRILIIDQMEMLFAGVEDAEWQAIHTQSRPLVKFFTEFFYHDVALTEITRKYKETIMDDNEIRDILLKLRY